MQGNWHDARLDVADYDRATSIERLAFQRPQA